MIIRSDWLFICLPVHIFLYFYILEKEFLSSEFFSLLSNTLDNSVLELLFGVAFVFTVETGFIPTSLTEHFDSVDSNIKLANLIKDNLPIKSFWHQEYNIFTTQLVMSNELCHMTGIPLNNSSLIITLSHSNTSKCIIIDDSIFNKQLLNFYIQYKNEVSVPIKRAVLEISNYTGQIPSLCGIPEELILLIMGKLDATNLVMLMRTCKQMKYLAANQNLWKKLVQEELNNVHNHFCEQKSCEGQFKDWRKCFIELRNKRFGRKKTPIIRQF